MDEVTIKLSQRDAGYLAILLRMGIGDAPQYRRDRAEKLASIISAAAFNARDADQQAVDAEKNYVLHVARDGLLYGDDQGRMYLVAPDVYERQIPQVDAAVRQLIRDGVLTRTEPDNAVEGRYKVVPAS